ncbi:protein C15orf41 homolog isoform X2 [Cryptotermes secundus]|uniref:protein C15orf41 homolog isoform X2 n=1 Tax=Cryptotermes secundus TaxID=105785 RepID=UPI000CD7C3E5|nr:protein C15orf41 homolog isoform X2 [Cryptotermes secundus]
MKPNFPGVSDLTLASIYSLEYQRKMKRTHQKFYNIIEELYDRYTSAIEAGEDVGVMLRLAEEIDLSPALLARMILEKFYEKHSEEGAEPATKSFLTKLMKDTTLIKDKDLAYEIYLCVVYDDQYGAITDCVKHSLGQEYEFRLQRMVKDLNIPFRDEEHLRRHGYDKTPDIKLEIPFAVDGFVVNWIESKALFGDEEGHNTYFKDQYLSYWNRFGPGLVIYWLGFIETLELRTEKCIIIREDFPTNITLMDPTSIEPHPVTV